MDLNRLNKFVDSASKASSISKARSSFINEVKNLKEGYQSQLLEAREPITKLEEKRILSQKKSDDERQDNLITQLQDNQRAITTELRDIKFDRQALLDELPRPAAIEHPEYKKAPHSAGVTPPPIPPRPWEKPQEQLKTIGIDFNKKFNKEEKEILLSYDLPSVENLLKLSEERLLKIKDDISNINTNEIGRKKTKITKKLHSKAKDDPKYKELEREKVTLDKYKNFVESLLTNVDILPKGSGAPLRAERGGIHKRKYKQSKRNAYKIQNSHFGGLLVDYPKLMNNMLLDVYKNDKLVYQDKADKSLIDLLTKRYNPKTKYSIDAVRIFNDLNLLTNMAKHKSSKKSNMIGSSLWPLPPAHGAGGSSLVDPNKLAKRLEIIVGSLNAGNNSRILKNDLTLINNELHRIGAITKEMHDALFKKYG